MLPEHFLPVASVPSTAVCWPSRCLSRCDEHSVWHAPGPRNAESRFRSSMASRAVAGVGSVGLRQRSLLARSPSPSYCWLPPACSFAPSSTWRHCHQGFNPNGVMIAKASLDDARFPRSRNFPKAFGRKHDRHASDSRSAKCRSRIGLPYERALNDGVTLSDGKEAGQQDAADVAYVTPGYFDTLQMPLLAGRMFTDTDGPTAQHVAVVNQAFARKFYGGTNPIGRFINKDTRSWAKSRTFRFLRPV